MERCRGLFGSELVAVAFGLSGGGVFVFVWLSRAEVQSYLRRPEQGRELAGRDKGMWCVGRFLDRWLVHRMFFSSTTAITSRQTCRGSANSEIRTKRIVESRSMGYRLQTKGPLWLLVGNLPA